MAETPCVLCRSGVWSDVCLWAKFNPSNCAPFWEGNCSSPRTLGLVREATTLGEDWHNPVLICWDADMEKRRTKIWSIYQVSHVGAVFRVDIPGGQMSWNSPNTRAHAFPHHPLPHLFFSSWEKTFLRSHFLAPTALCRRCIESHAELVVIIALRVISVSEYNVCLIICNPLNCELHNSCSYSMP